MVRLDGAVLDGDRHRRSGGARCCHRTRPASSRRRRSADASLRLPELGRFRVNLHRERGRAAAAIRVLPARVPRLAELALPPEVEALSTLGRGLVLVGGATGAGKTTTLAALVDEINRRDARHIITVEDPIEYEHQHERSHRRAGRDRRRTRPTSRPPCAAPCARRPTCSSSARCATTNRCALRCRRPRPGIWCFSSLHTTDIASTIARICDSFPNERQNTIRQELSLALSAVMTQTLMPKIGGGRVPAVELLMVSYGARQHIRKNALQHLHQEMSITRKQGSLTLEESLARLVRAGQITQADAHGARRPSRRAREHSAAVRRV